MKKRRELMAIVSLAAGLSMSLSAVSPAHADKLSAVMNAQPQGFIKSGNPKAAGGPDNPGKGNPFNIY